jgi:succinoglycan biosynthesis protein ExoA
MSEPRATAAPRLLIVIPCLNEAKHLPKLLTWLAHESATQDALIVVADGGSNDGSQKIVEDFAQGDARLKLLHNERHIQSAGVNRAVERFGESADLIIRIDAHAGYPEAFLSRLIAAQIESGADSVVIAMHAKPHSGRFFQIANATAQNSVLGTGGSAHRAEGERRFVDHGHHALFTADAFRRIGGYDETFSHNEDAEFDVRLTASGGRILLAGDIVIDYYPRTSARALWRQYFKFGAGRAMNIQKHKTPLKPRQLAPLVIAPCALLALLTPFCPWFGAPFAAYVALCLIAGALIGVQSGKLCGLAAGLPAAIMHLAWSFGYWSRVLRAS